MVNWIDFISIPRTVKVARRGNRLDRRFCFISPWCHARAPVMTSSYVYLDQIAMGCQQCSVRDMYISVPAVEMQRLIVLCMDAPSTPDASTIGWATHVLITQTPPCKLQSSNRSAQLFLIPFWIADVSLTAGVHLARLCVAGTSRQSRKPLNQSRR